MRAGLLQAGDGHGKPHLLRSLEGRQARGAIRAGCGRVEACEVEAKQDVRENGHADDFFSEVERLLEENEDSRGLPKGIVMETPGADGRGRKP